MSTKKLPSSVASLSVMNMLRWIMEDVEVVGVAVTPSQHRRNPHRRFVNPASAPQPGVLLRVRSVLRSHYVLPPHTTHYTLYTTHSTLHTDPNLSPSIDMSVLIRDIHSGGYAPSVGSPSVNSIKHPCQICKGSLPKSPDRNCFVILIEQPLQSLRDWDIR